MFGLINVFCELVHDGLDSQERAIMRMCRNNGIPLRKVFNEREMENIYREVGSRNKKDIYEYYLGSAERRRRRRR